MVAQLAWPPTLRDVQDPRLHSLEEAMSVTIFTLAMQMHDDSGLRCLKVPTRQVGF